jgi:hypothetical protein
MRSRALVLVVLLLSYGALSARQPAVRVLAPLPAPAQSIADALEINSVDRGLLVLNTIRTIYATTALDVETGPRIKLRRVLANAGSERGELVPLPLDPSIWRDTILLRPVADDAIIGAILQDRTGALIYHGLAGLDDETLAWLGPERETLQHMLRHAGAFAMFGSSIRVRAGRVVVPGGPDFEAAWHAAIGADPAKPAAFIRRLFNDESGQLAWFYDAVSQLDDASLRFATGATGPPGARADRLRALLDVFDHVGPERRIEAQPFTRRTFDPALTLSVLRVTNDGTLVGPVDRGFWDRLFADEDRPFTNKPMTGAGNSAPIDAAWLLSRFHKVPVDAGKRRLDTFLFAQRVFASQQDAGTVDQALALRGYMSFPALMMTLERAGVRSPAVMGTAATRADALGRIGDDRRQRAAILQFQSAIAIVDRMSRSRGVTPQRAEELIASLAAIDCTTRGYDGHLAAWVRKNLVPALRQVSGASGAEGRVLAAMAGVFDNEPRLIDWEGRAYRVSAARAEFNRLERARQQQRGLSLSDALALFDKDAAKQAPDREMALADAMTSIVYAAYLGDPEGPAMSGGNIAVRHELGIPGANGPRGAWRLPSESHSGRGWRISGSLLGLDAALARMALRRLDFNVMPPEPKLVSAERQTAALSVALLNAASLRDAERDEIAAALARGQARVMALDGDRGAIDEVARDAGLSAWRREALAWTAVNDRDQLGTQLSPLETMWLGKPRGSAGNDFDNWGAAVLPLSGCLCLAMPRPRPWEPLTGRPSLGLLATRGADVAILVAAALASSRLPAELAPGVIAFAMQEVLDQARPSYMDDWSEFTRAARALSREALDDFIAAQAAGGALLPKNTEDRQ